MELSSVANPVVGIWGKMQSEWSSFLAFTGLGRGGIPPPDDGPIRSLFTLTPFTQTVQKVGPSDQIPSMREPFMDQNSEGSRISQRDTSKVILSRSATVKYFKFHAAFWKIL